MNVKTCQILLLLAALVAACLADGHMGKKGKGGKGGKMMGMLKNMYKWSRNIEFYEAESEDDDCGNVPEDTMMGFPKKLACMDRDPGEEVCMCMKKTPEMLEALKEVKGKDLTDKVNPDTGFMLSCGMCKDPCMLRWEMEEDEMEKEIEDMMPPPPPPPPMSAVPNNLEDMPRGARALMDMAMQIMGNSICASMEESGSDSDDADDGEYNYDEEASESHMEE